MMCQFYIFFSFLCLRILYITLTLNQKFWGFLTKTINETENKKVRFILPKKNRKISVIG